MRRTESGLFVADDAACKDCQAKDRAITKLQQDLRMAELSLQRVSLNRESRRKELGSRRLSGYAPTKAKKPKAARA